MSRTEDGSVVVGVDGSPSARHAALWAAGEAARRGVPLTVVHALPADGGPTTAPPWLDELAADVRRGGTVEVDVRLPRGTPVSLLVDAAQRARLVVVGGWGADAYPGMLAGSVALALVTHAPCPVAVVRGGAPEAAPASRGPVVVGVDGSPTSDAALDEAFDIATAWDAELVAVHTWSDVVPGPSGEVVRLREDWSTLATRAEELLAERLAARREAYPGVVVGSRVLADRPVRALLGEAETARLLVVGHRGEGGFSGMLLGSTSQVLVQYAPCPVLVMRPTDVRA
ncbi:universal stress protein [Pseudonocardia humida]|uniref:Universal stress protein n=1 Tax=Pseudonocardia humida TaxID=2800819 RepID=A0ABT1A7R3_9PSEU|nr:universal stress protein [Pseudonocardia humida]MCO1659057.1 universal stress protein [Pseudonocardia humida]